MEVDRGAGVFGGRLSIYSDKDRDICYNFHDVSAAFLPDSASFGSCGIWGQEYLRKGAEIGRTVDSLGT